MQKTKTDRGFDYSEFKDRYGQMCSIQKSSSATEDSIWFGVNDADPKIMASDARKMGIPTPVQVGWIPFAIPKEVLLSTRMHLNQAQVKELLPILQHFAETGELP